MKKALMVFLFSVMLAISANASEDPYVYEEYAGVQAAFPKEWSTSQSEDGTTTWYYPGYVYVNDDTIGHIMVQRPKDEVPEQSKELFLFYYKNDLLETTHFNSISHFDVSGVECERAGFTQTYDGKEYEGEMVIIVNNGSAIVISYMEQPDADTDLKDDFEKIISSISLTSGEK